ncbi:MAG: caspase family protein [Chitinophagaceae bacterium]|nr:caspase family protein [Chitinophagaceae bacterium]
MSYGISVHVALNKIDPAYYGNDGALAGCINDLKAMKKISVKYAYDEIFTFIDEESTHQHLVATLKYAAKKLKAKDTLFITYSGHGGSVRDNNKDESDGLDETWCLYDRMILDDELGYLWSKFKKGVRIIMVSDSCHSGSVSRGVLTFDGSIKVSEPVGRNRLFKDANKVYMKNRKLYDSEGEKNIIKGSGIKATILLFSGCQDNQLSSDGDKNGLFTEKLLKAWGGGKFKGNYAGLLTKVLKGMPRDQTPNYSRIGLADAAFEGSAPFVKA